MSFYARKILYKMNIGLPNTLSAAIQQQAICKPLQDAIVIIGEDRSEQVITYCELHTKTMQCASKLHLAGVAKGDLVLIVLPHSRELLTSLLGCLYLGAPFAIFTYMMPLMDVQKYIERARKLVASTGVKAVITCPDFIADFLAALTDIDCQVCNSSQICTANTDNDFTSEVPSQEDNAVLQFSSGTTGTAKGIMLSHRDILANINAVSQSMHIRDDDVIVSWLPLYHDMGLFTALLLALTNGITIVSISPLYWIRHPKIMFHCISRYQGTIVYMPNFAFNHCTRVIRDRDLQTVDLSSLRCVINASEPVRKESIHMFWQRFSAYGLNKGALLSGYGMAENVSAVSRTPFGQMPDIDWVCMRKLQEKKHALPIDKQSEEATAIVSCGFPIPGVEVRVVDDDDNILPERCVGELTLRSEYMLKEYYRYPQLTVQAIRAGWFYTGDIGYIAQGQIYICGRKKDMLIVGGSNVLPEDIEKVASRLPEIENDRVVAFGVFDDNSGSEKAILVCELQAKLGTAQQYQLKRKIRQQIVEELNITLGGIKFVATGWIVKTTSGKIARSANRDKYCIQLS